MQIKRKEANQKYSFQTLPVTQQQFNSKLHLVMRSFQINSPQKNKIKKNLSADKSIALIQPKPWFLPIISNNQETSLVSICHYKPMKLQVEPSIQVPIKAKTETSETFSIHRTGIHARKQIIRPKNSIHSQQISRAKPRINYQLKNVDTQSILGPWELQNFDF